MEQPIRTPMKTSLLPLLALSSLAAALPAQAQIFRPQTINGAVLGGIAGAIIGNNSGDHNGGRGALIGAVAGGLLASAAGDEQAHRAQAPYAPARANPVLGPVLLGGIAGAIIGNNSGSHNPWRGAAIGAGYILHRISEHEPRRPVFYPPAPVAAVYASAPVVYASAPNVAPAPQSVTIINNYYYAPATPMSEANAMFGR